MKQKNLTKEKPEKSKKESRRSRSKYPALERKFTLKTRQEYFEPEYVNGTFNKTGEQVIRPLNHEEKEFLNKFYEETVGANFLHDKTLKNLHKQIKELKKKESPTEEDTERLNLLQLEYCSVADEVLMYPDHEDQKKLYGENNARNRCLYNRSKSIGILDELNDKTYDEFHNNVYNNPDSGELAVINTIEPKLKTNLKKKIKDDQKA